MSRWIGSSKCFRSAFGDPEGMRFHETEQNGHPVIRIETGPVVERALAGMRSAIDALAAEGNDLIVNDVFEAEQDAEYRQLLSPFTVWRVKVTAPLGIIEARERARGDRAIGLARGQFDRLHEAIVYDLEIDAGRATPLECAKQIKATFGL